MVPQLETKADGPAGGVIADRPGPAGASESSIGHLICQCPQLEWICASGPARGILNFKFQEPVAVAVNIELGSSNFGHWHTALVAHWHC